ncbi:MAG TPA: thiol oxidoreductase, partial [Bacteroidota bacterium]
MYFLKYLSFIALTGILFLAGCEQLVSTKGPVPNETLAGPIDGLTPAQRAAHAQGDEEFGRIFGVSDGLGPIFVNTSCEGCHIGDGKGASFIQLTRFGRREQTGTFDPLRHLGGPQLQQRSIAGYPAETIPSVATGYSVLLPPAVTGLGLLANVP